MLRVVATAAAISALTPAGALGAPPAAKVDSALRALAAADRSGAQITARARRAGLAVTPGERVSVDVYVLGNPEHAVAALRAAGMDVRARAGDLVGGLVPIERVDDVAALAATRAVSAALPGIADAGAKTSEGDAAHNGPAARALGGTGAGVKVGVISDSINQVSGGITASQGTGDLPASVQVLKDHAGQDDEGRAMAEIVYDLAPGVTQMAFASGTGDGAAGGNAANKADSINRLVTAGAKVIVDDIAFLSEPFFQDGAVAQAVDAAKAAGVAYFASAGNRARQSYEAQTAFGANPSQHDFDPGAGVDTVQALGTVNDGVTLTVVLQWDEFWQTGANGVQTDLNAALVKPDGSALPADPVVGGSNANITTGLAREVVTWHNASGAPQPVALRITRVAGTRSPFIKDILSSSSGSGFAFAPEFWTSSDAINPDAASALGAITVGAVRHSNVGLNDAESFSSRGPKTRLFTKTGTRLSTPEVRQKPDVAAADGVSTTVPGFTTFSGTSAAAPHAGAIAVLALSAKPTLAIDALRAVIDAPAVSIDCSTAGRPDPDCGFGFVLADRVVGTILDTTAPDVAVTVGGAPANAAGWARGDVSATWTVADAQSPIGAAPGCEPFALLSDGVRDLTCTATSAGGTTTRSVTLRRDATPPTPPVVTGITTATVTAAGVPPAAAVGCTATDATSGVASCVVRGYGAQTGRHVLQSTATDVAGNVATATRAYTVTRRPTAGDVASLPSARRCRTRRAGVRVTLRRTSLGGVRRVRVTLTGRRAKTVGTLPRTVSFRSVRRSRAVLTVRVTFSDGRTSTVRRTYRFSGSC